MARCLIPVTKDLGRVFPRYQWLHGLSSSARGLRLGFCLALDIASGALDPKTLRHLLKAYGEGTRDPALSLDLAIVTSTDKQETFCASRLPVPALDEFDCYVRVLELGDFIDYYAGPTYGYASGDPGDVAEVRTSFFRADSPSDLGDISEWWSGRRPRVFVLSRKDLNDFIQQSVPDADDIASTLNDALGLGKRNGVAPDGSCELVAILYPPETTDIAFRQPTSLDADWSSERSVFLTSGKIDGWGRTWSCSGSQPTLRERVHKPFKGLTDKFSTLYLGIARSPEEDFSGLLCEIESRLKKELLTQGLSVWR